MTIEAATDKQNQPFYWKARGAWYVKDGSSQRRLSTNRTEAFRIWREQNAGYTVSQLIELFLRNCRGAVAERTFKAYERYLMRFASEFGEKRAQDVIAFDLADWSNCQPTWGTASRRQAITAVKRCFNWAVSMELLERSAVQAVPKPATERRETVVPDDLHAQLMRFETTRGGNRSARAFRQILIALRHSGARPSTVASVTAENVSTVPAVNGEGKPCEAVVWILRDHKTRKKTGKPLVVYPGGCLQTLTRILMSHRKTGPLFQNSRGQPWSPDAIGARLARCRNQLNLPAGIVAYAYRHSFATAAIKNGVDVATVAELLGHGDVSMIQKHYGHLTDEKQHLLSAAAKAVKPPA